MIAYHVAEIPIYKGAEDLRLHPLSQTCIRSHTYILLVPNSNPIEAIETMTMQCLLLAIQMASIFHMASSARGTISDNSTIGVDSIGTAYEVLEDNGLPPGLLPLGVESYTLKGGNLAVTLPNTCEFSVPIAGKQYKFRYDSTIGGVLQDGSISRVYGVRLQVEFAWLGLSQIQHLGDQLKLQLETSTQSFPASAFALSPRCN